MEGFLADYFSLLSQELVKLVKTVATTVYKLATDGKEPPVPLDVSAKLVSGCIVFILEFGIEMPSKRTFISFHRLLMKCKRSVMYEPSAIVNRDTKRKFYWCK